MELDTHYKDKLKLVNYTLGVCLLQYNFLLWFMWYKDERSRRLGWWPWSQS